MEQTLREFVTAAQNAHIASPAFSAVQTVEAGDVRMTASVAIDRSFVSVEYQSYADPFSKLQESLLGNIEYTAEDMPNLRATYDGKTTWVYDRSREIAVRYSGWLIPSPFASLRTLGELRFLAQLTSDFLFAEGPRESLHGRQGREVRLKPRTSLQPQLLRELRFPFRKASILFDIETYFPLRIVAHPAPGSSWSMLLPPNVPLVLTYRDVHHNPPEARLRYVPLANTRQFIGQTMSTTEVADFWPSPLPLDAFHELGYRVDGDRAHTIWDSASSQGQVTIEFVATAKASDQADASDEPPRLILRVSNYLLHNLGRRKATISGYGNVHEVDGQRVRILNRSSLTTEGNAIPGLPSICEAFWETDGFFWFLLGEQLDESSLLQIVLPLIK